MVMMIIRIRWWECDDNHDNDDNGDKDDYDDDNDKDYDYDDDNRWNAVEYKMHET